MNKLRANVSLLIWATAVAVAGALFIAGCATHKSSKQSADSAAKGKTITDIRTDPINGSMRVIVSGNQKLVFTSVRQPDPLSVILYFSDTSLTAVDTMLNPDSDIIGPIRAFETKKDGINTKVQISLKKDASFEVSRNKNDLIIAFGSYETNDYYGETGSSDVYEERSVDNDSYASYDRYDDNTYEQPPPSSLGPSATRLESVYASKLNGGLKVFVGANGSITNYKAFTIESPPRIVFDIFNIKSPYKNEKTIPVNSEWVKRVRYYGYPDRLRLVLDTVKSYLNSYAAEPSENGLLIHVGAGAQFMEREIEDVSLSTPLDSSVASGTSLKSVYATQQTDGMTVNVRSNGAIKDYKSYTVDNPPRIIFDIYNITSDREKRDSFPVDTQWVKRVRYNGYRDRLQVVIETQKRFLSAYKSFPDRNGLVIKIGQGLASETYAGKKFPRNRMVKSGGKEAWVDKIDFIGEDAGKSKLVIGTSGSINYDIEKETPKKLNLKLYDAKIPDFRKRDLITDRFESAVDQIKPIQEAGVSSFEIDLREAVPYFVEQTENELIVHFEASSISPPPVEEMGGSLQAGVESTGAPETIAVTDLGTASIESPGMVGAPPLAPPMAGLTPVDQQKYTGEKIALDFYKMDIKNVFRILREISGKNFAIDKDVVGEVTLTLDKPVPWDQVLDLILKMNRLGKVHEGDIIRIATNETLEREEAEFKKKQTEEMSLLQQQKELEPLYTEYIAINYSNAKSEIQPHIEKILTKERGTISVDDRTNMIIITDTAEKIKQAKEIVSKLDRVTPQVVIEARIVEASSTFSRDIGVDWEVQGGISNDADNAGTGPQRGYDTLGGTYGYDLSTNFPEMTPYGTLGFNFMRILGSELVLSAKLQALESQGKLKIVSAPKIMTLDNKAAKIKQGLRYPYQTVEDGDVNIEFENVDLLLEVMPHVTPDNRISMQIKVTKNDLGEVINSEQSFTTKEANTELLVNDGDTVVIGGIIKTTTRSADHGIPGLSKIPLLGWLFKQTTNEDQKEELLIFITPRIIQLEQRVIEY